MDLQLSSHESLPYWVGFPIRFSETYRLLGRTEIGAAQRERSRSNDTHLMVPSYSCVPRAEYLCRYSTTGLANGAHVWCKDDDGLRWRGKISTSTVKDGIHMFDV